MKQASMLYDFNVNAGRRLRESPNRNMICVRNADMAMGQTLFSIVKNGVDKGFSLRRFFNAELMGGEAVVRRNLLNECGVDRV